MTPHGLGMLIMTQLMILENMRAQNNNYQCVPTRYQPIRFRIQGFTYEIFPSCSYDYVHHRRFPVTAVMVKSNNDLKAIVINQDKIDAWKDDPDSWGVARGLGVLLLFSHGRVEIVNWRGDVIGEYNLYNREEAVEFFSELMRRATAY